jgi:hypothetical protein
VVYKGAPEKTPSAQFPATARKERVSDLSSLARKLEMQALEKK